MGSRKPTKNMICFPSDGASFFLPPGHAIVPPPFVRPYCLLLHLSDDGPSHKAAAKMCSFEVGGSACSVDPKSGVQVYSLIRDRRPSWTTWKHPCVPTIRGYKGPPSWCRCASLT